MTNITEFSIWENGIYQLETEDPALGGAPAIVDGEPVAGHANAQAKQLANRTTYLKTTHETFVSDLADNTDSAKGAELIGYQGGTVADKLGEIVAGAVTPPFVDAAIDVHNHSGVAHPELSAFITSEADRAENAADAAQASGDIYIDTTAGLAATTNGQYFSVPSADSNEYLILYKNNAGVALEVKRYPSATLIDSLFEKSPTRDVFRWLDSVGKAAMRLTEKGKFIVAGRKVFDELDLAASTALRFFSDGASRSARASFRDENGKQPIEVTRSGRVRIWRRDVLRELDRLASGDAFAGLLADINQQLTPSKNLLVIGDSLSAYTGSWARTILEALDDPARGLTNIAVGGHTSSQQAGRLGALPFLLTFQGNKINASGSTAVTASQMLRPDGVTMYTVWPISSQGTGPTWRARVSGVVGTFSSATFTGEVPDALVFTPDPGQLVSDLPVEIGVPTESVWAETHEYDTLLLCLGRNNYSETDTVKRDWLAIRDWQRTLNKRLIAVTPPNMAGEGSSSGPSLYAKFVDLERYAQSIFAENVVISRQVLMRHGDGGATDNAAIADNRVPPSLTTDGLHWTVDAGHVYIREAAATIINRKGW